MSKIKTLGKFMKNPLKYAVNQASCVSKGKKLGLSHSDARNACKPHYKEKGKILSKLKKSKPMDIRRSNQKKRNPEKDVLTEIKRKRNA